MNGAAVASRTARRLGRRGLLFGGAPPPSEPPPARVAAIAQSCLAFRGVACMACRDACHTGAIRFALAPGGARPRVEADACTGCADCAPVCPADAIAMATPTRKEAPGA